MYIEEEEYDDIDEYEMYDNALMSFTRRMLLIKVFSKLDNTFNKEQFKKAFSRTFKSAQLEDEELEAAFDTSVDLEVIEETKKGSKIYIFNGIAIVSEDYN